MSWYEPTLGSYKEFKAEDFTIEESEGKYGPIWIVRLIDSSGKPAYVLRSCEKMTHYKGAGPDYKPGVHLDCSYEVDPLKHSGGWKGVYRVDTMKEAFQCLLNDLNRNQQLRILEYALEDLLNSLSSRVEDLSGSFEDFTHKKADSAFKDVEEAFEKLSFQYRSMQAELDEL